MSKEDTGAFLIDTGYLIIRILFKSVIQGYFFDTPLSILPTRVNEFMTVGNVKSISQNLYPRLLSRTT